MNNIGFSLIMATYGRKDDVFSFLKSIESQIYDKSKIEIIIVDQNDIISLDSIINDFKKSLNIIHIKSKIKGVSYNKNLGLKVAKGDIIGFPDDDCRYYPETLLEIESFLKKNKQIDVVLGKIYDKDINRNIIRNWSEKSFKVSFYNFYLNTSSITIFANKNKLFFDDNLGVGTKFGSCEDIDYVAQLLKNKKHIYYNPNIIVWHPEEKANSFDYKKINTYSMGFGAFCKKHKSISILILFFKSLIYHFMTFIKGILLLNKHITKKGFNSFFFRIKGFYKYDIK